MYLILEKALQWEKEYAVSTTAHIPLMSSPVPILTITLGYILFVLKIGPHLMRNRMPVNVRNLMLAFNVLQIILNLYTALGAFYLIYLNISSLGCLTSLSANHPVKSVEIHLNYVYLLIKISDFVDTIFFVLRKSFKQITFLHVYHHAFMVLCTFAIMRYYGTGGHHTVVGQLNSIVHVVMYAYYFMSAIRPEVRESKWKRYITQMQMVQFIMIFIHQAWALFFSPGCRYPKILAYSNMLQAVVMFALFGNFYIKTYLKQKTSKSSEKSYRPKEKSHKMIKVLKKS